MQQEHPGLKATEVTPTDAKTYRDHPLAKRYAPTTINRALISLMLFFDTLDGTNPFRHLTMIEIVEPAPVALSKAEWNAVRRCAEQAARRGLLIIRRGKGLKHREVPLVQEAREPLAAYFIYREHLADQ